MASLNPNALALVALTTCIGALAGSWLIGLTAGLVIVIAITLGDGRGGIR
jgi:hypothetical protein